MKAAFRCSTEPNSPHKAHKLVDTNFLSTNPAAKRESGAGARALQNLAVMRQRPVNAKRFGVRTRQRRFPTHANRFNQEPRETLI
jgi:hypothetical protein